jgi:hypothetical protein
VSIMSPSPQKLLSHDDMDGGRVAWGEEGVGLFNDRGDSRENNTLRGSILLH